MSLPLGRNVLGLGFRYMCAGGETEVGRVCASWAKLASRAHKGKRQALLGVGHKLTRPASGAQRWGFRDTHQRTSWRLGTRTLQQAAAAGPLGSPPTTWPGAPSPRPQPPPWPREGKQAAGSQSKNVSLEFSQEVENAS